MVIYQRLLKFLLKRVSLRIEYCNNNRFSTKVVYLKAMKALVFLSLLILLAGLPACGMQGDLYLPDEKAEKES